MGSTSSKDHDANPHDLGTNINAAGGLASPKHAATAGNGRYPLHHHPHYAHDAAGGPGGGGPAGGVYGGYGHTPPQPPPPPDSSGLYHARDGPHGGDGPSRPGGDAMEIDQSAPGGSSGGRGGELGAYGLPQPPSHHLGRKDPSGLRVGTPSEVVPMVFRWEHGGRNVYITGTFNGWSKQCPMHRSGNDFTYIANLTRGKHAYKFVVDEEWRFAPDQLTVADVEGNVNNFVDVSDFEPLSDFDFGDDAESEEQQYGRFIPDIDEYTKEPPPLPPHLRHIILNKNPPSVDTRLLPVPQHVALNHLYCTAIKDGMMVLGVTQRYKQKFVTTVYYSLMPGTT